ncbi:hypothetical protein B0T10DRAFT_490365 [Thelonectria olida]|uniref:NAD(P)-binding domain-containing protein n=1 Tax=Thelonectria olida TaxID=1576542 RepID=A0A9P8W3H5_9HYPO|nr:hypothetical protein B0T10DRAFT_490365 [Thelonectria olida]
MSTPRVLILGGSASLSRLMTLRMVSKSWDVISVIRDPAQRSQILQIGNGQKGKVEVLIQDLEKLMGVRGARRILEQARPNIVVFVAGSTRKPFAVDRDASKSFMEASTNDNSVSKFLFISFPSSRRGRAPWWTDEDFQDWMVEKRSYPDIWQAKLEADEYLVALANARARRGGPSFQAISLRPTWLTNSKGTGKVHLGKSRAVGQVTREDVAAVALALLSRHDTRGWFDLFQGDDEIEEAVDSAVRRNVNCIDGEDVERIHELAV